MKRIAFVIPYFGKLPAMFPAWLNSCQQNPTIDFIVFTDDKTTYNYPDNVKVEYTTFDKLKKQISNLFDFENSLDTPYKLCDYRPTYGLVFAKWLKDYDFWGHCDIDLIWGNIRNFFTDDLLEKYERVQWLGHCSIYKNCDKVNNYFRTLDNKGCMDWKKVYTTKENQSFDEYAEHNGGGLSLIMEKNDIPMYKKWIFADLALNLKRFQLSYTENSYYTTDEDSRSAFFERAKDGLFLVYKKNGELRKTEFMYVHFQKRNLKTPANVQSDNYIILPPGKLVVTNAPLTDKQKQKRLRKNNRKQLVGDYFNSFALVKCANKVKNRLRRI